MRQMTEREMLRFESIFDLLTELGFSEDQARERMVATGGTQAVAFAQIGGRTVAEFVRWGMENGLLLPYLIESLLRERRFLRKPPAWPTLNQKRS